MVLLWISCSLQEEETLADDRDMVWLYVPQKEIRHVPTWNESGITDFIVEDG